MVRAIARSLNRALDFRARRRSRRARRRRRASTNRNRRLLERILWLQADEASRRVRALPAGTPLAECEYGIHSQFGEDGILQHLTAHVPLHRRRFVEFGVEDFQEANCRYLMEREPWEGLVLDSAPGLPARLAHDPLHFHRALHVVSAFVTAENIDALISEAGFSGDLGILSIDVDGNDYWIWKALSVATPRIVVVEYNSLFGPSAPATIPYDPAFDRREAHWSWLYAGAGLAALCALGEEKGYAFVGSNCAGNNAFFVRKDVLGSLRPLGAREGWVESTFREARDAHGEHTWLSGRARLEPIGQMPLVDVVTGRRLLVRDLPRY